MIKPFSTDWWLEQYKMAIESKMRAYKLICEGETNLIEQYTRLEVLAKYIRIRIKRKVNL